MGTGEWQSGRWQSGSRVRRPHKQQGGMTLSSVPADSMVYRVNITYKRVHEGFVVFSRVYGYVGVVRKVAPLSELVEFGAGLSFYGEVGQGGGMGRGEKR